MLTCLLTTTFPGHSLAVSLHSPVKRHFILTYNIQPKFGTHLMSLLVFYHYFPLTADITLTTGLSFPTFFHSRIAGNVNG